MQDKHDLSVLIQSQIPIITLETKEERRALALLEALPTILDLPLYRWSVTEGLLCLAKGFSIDIEQSRKPTDVLNHIQASLTKGIYILLDFHPYLNDPTHVRLFKDIAIGYHKAERTLVLLSHHINLPDELNNYTAQFEMSLPSREQIADEVKKIAKHWAKENAGRRVKADSKAFDMLLNNLSGLTLAEVRRLARVAIYEGGAITESDIPELLKAKYELLGTNSVLQFEYETEKFSDIAGFSKVKTWLQHREKAFIEDVPGLDKPKGLLLLGVQGCGKSLAAKAVAGVWGLPLLHMDFGALFNKYHGETERNLRQALKTAEVMSPCVLWVDEIEKALSSSDNDDGTSKRVLATLLTWMAEKDKPVFMVATANDIEALPPELIRKGRFDEIFFVDLPKHSTREAIFQIHLQRRNLDPALFNCGDLAAISKGFSGAEIEQAIVSALYSSYAQNETLSEVAVAEVINNTRPLSVVMAEKITALQEWANGRTVPAD